MRLRRPQPGRAGAIALTLALFASACSGQDNTSSEFCDKLTEVTGAGGVESALAPGDPARIDGVVVELTELHERAPEEISATTRTLLNFFRSYQRAARTDRRQVIADNEVALATASEALDAYALGECGLFLQRSLPTPVPTVNPNIEVGAD